MVIKLKREGGDREYFKFNLNYLKRVREKELKKEEDKEKQRESIQMIFNIHSI